MHNFHILVGSINVAVARYYIVPVEIALADADRLCECILGHDDLSKMSVV